jgi:MFS family permease
VSRWDLVVLWIAYLLWFISLSGTANLSLYVGEAIGREPKDFSGLMLALRFGCKAAAGALLAMVLVRRGARTALAATAALLAGVYFWVFFASGYAYLLAFALVGAGELGTVYVSNYAISASPHERLTQNLALLELTSLFSSAGPALHGALTDAYGFKGSFALGLITGIISLALISILPARRSPRPAPQA